MAGGTQTGQRVGQLGVANDMTARKQIEAILREASVSAQQAVRLKSQCLANRSDEIRTPMNGSSA